MKETYTITFSVDRELAELIRSELVWRGCSQAALIRMALKAFILNKAERPD